MSSISLISKKSLLWFVMGGRLRQALLSSNDCGILILLVKEAIRDISEEFLPAAQGQSTFTGFLRGEPEEKRQLSAISGSFSEFRVFIKAFYSPCTTTVSLSDFTSSYSSSFLYKSTFKAVSTRAVCYIKSFTRCYLIDLLIYKRYSFSRSLMISSPPQMHTFIDRTISSFDLAGGIMTIFGSYESLNEADPVCINYAAMRFLAMSSSSLRFLNFYSYFCIEARVPCISQARATPVYTQTKPIQFPSVWSRAHSQDSPEIPERRARKVWIWCFLPLT